MITLRKDKGSKLTHDEMDANFKHLLNPSGKKVYKALLAQNGTNAPVATVLENTLGEGITWIYNAPGYYAGIMPTAVDANVNNTFVQCTNTNSGGLDHVNINAAYYVEDGFIYLTTYLNNVASNDVLSNQDGYNRTSIIIEVYP